MTDDDKRLGLMSRIRRSAVRAAKPLLDITTGVPYSSKVPLLSTEELNARLEGSMKILSGNPGEHYVVDTKSLKRHSLTNHKIYTAFDKEDDSQWRMVKLPETKRVLFYEFGVLALYPHKNLVRLRETYLYQSRFFVFTELAPKTRSLKSILYQPTHTNALESVRFLREKTQSFATEQAKRTSLGRLSNVRRFTNAESSSHNHSNNSSNDLDTSSEMEKPLDFSRLFSTEEANHKDRIDKRALPDWLKLKEESKKVDFRYTPWPEEVVCYILQQILTGLSYLHENNVIHRDMRSENITVDKYGRVKISDVLFSRVLTKESPRSKTVIGTVYFMSPETMRGWEYNQIADIWGFGIMAIEIAEGRVEHESETDHHAIMKSVILNPPPTLHNWLPWSFEFRRLLRLCLNHNANARLSSDKLLADKWFTRAIGLDNFALFLEDLQ